MAIKAQTKKGTRVKIMLLMLIIISVFKLIPCSAVAEEEKTLYDYLSDDVKQMLAAEYDGWFVSEGTSIYVHDGWNAWLLFLSEDEKNIAIIMENHGSGFEIVAINDAIIPDGAAFEGYWWVGADHNEDNKAFIWYTPENWEQGFFYDLQHDEDDGCVWSVKSGLFGDDKADHDRHNFYLANSGTALKVSGKSSFSPIYVPNDVDLTFSGFDPDGMRLLCAEAVALINEPALIPSTLKEDAIPQGQAIAFEKGQKYPVYFGPGEHFMQSGEYHNALVSTNDWIQVFGQEDGWLFIQYNIANEKNRFGYISAALPEGVDVPELHFTRKAGTLNCGITDDPLRRRQEINFPGGTECVQLATLGEEWIYIETVDADHPKYRGFAPADYVDLRENHAGKAIISKESTSLYEDASIEKPIGTYYGGVELVVLETLGDFSQVRIGDELVYQEGWIYTDDLAMSAVTHDIPFALTKAVLFPSETNSLLRAYTAASQDAQRINCDTFPVYTVLGDVGEFTQLSLQRGVLYSVLFTPRDWVVPIPQDIDDTKRTQIVLTEDCPVIVRPEEHAASHVTLYGGTTVICYPMGDWYFVTDYNLVPWTSIEVPTFGYLPINVCNQTNESIPMLKIGRLEPAKQGDNRWLSTSMYGSKGGVYGWGTRLILLGGTESWYLVLTPDGQKGFFDKADVVFTDYYAAQGDNDRLFYGKTILTENVGHSDIPYFDAKEWDKYQAGTEVCILGCLGDWWSVSIGTHTGFFPTEVLLEPPKDAPAYNGIYNAFRALPLCFTWDTEAPIVFTDNEAWLLLRENDRLVFSHMQILDGEWIEINRIADVLGEGVSMINHLTFDGNESPLQFTICCYLENSNVEIFNTFTRTDDSWRLSRFRMRESVMQEVFGEQVLFDHTYLIQDDSLIIQENGQQHEVVLTKPLVLDIERYSVKEMFRICLSAM